LIADAVRSFQRIGMITEIVCGEARGVDAMGKQLADAIKVPTKSFPADWDKYGKPAGYIRNKEMGMYADVLIAIWDGKSRGTRHMIDIMNELGKPALVYFSEKQR
jgi:hypothetical protein